jgi:signal transduction histidine kinase
MPMSVAVFDAPGRLLAKVRLGLKGRVLAMFFGVAFAGGLLFMALKGSHAVQERNEMRQQAINTATMLSNSFDQEVMAHHYLLRGLSHSPALVSGDLEAFYNQLKATTVSPDSWFVLYDLERQILNTLRPFGDQTLPRNSDWPDHVRIIERIRTLGSTVSGRLYGIVRRGIVIALTLRINGPDGQMTHFMQTILSENRLNTILASHALPAGWMAGLFDRDFNSIATVRDARHNPEVKSVETSRRLAEAHQRGAASGTFESVDERGTPVLVAYSRSPATDWTARVEIPLALLNAPIRRVLWDVALPCALLFFLGGIGALMTTREVEEPLAAMRSEVFLAQTSLNELSARLLAVQEDERQRIARELHDSTAQHLVAANLELMRLDSSLGRLPGVTANCDEIEDLIQKALIELRIFTYLLHPPDLATDGLQATLVQFITGFARRTALEATTAITPDVDRVPLDVQRALLRVVQEALTNVHRHARATRVGVRARTFSNWLIVSVRDNGSGFVPARQNETGAAPAMGVGIRGMNARLQQIGGRLMVRSRPGGTVVMAVMRMDVPMQPAIRHHIETVPLPA